jgi:hypothetical protein
VVQHETPSRVDNLPTATYTAGATASSSGTEEQFSLAKLLQTYSKQGSSDTTAGSSSSRYAPSDQYLHQDQDRKTEEPPASLAESYLDALEDIDLDIVEHVPGFFDDDKGSYSERK